MASNGQTGQQNQNNNGNDNSNNTVNRFCNNFPLHRLWKKVKTFFLTVTIDHDSTVYYIWLWIISVAVLYNATVIFLRASFVDVNLEHLKTWLLLDYLFADLMYLIDMFIRARTTYFQQGIIVTDTKVLWLRYFKSWQFAIDVISIFPIDLIYLGIGIIYTIVRINRFLRIGRYFEMTNRVESTANFPNVFRMFTTVFGVLIAIHYIAIFYYSYSKHIGFGQSQDEMDDFQLSQKRADSAFVTRYAYLYYWSTMTVSLKQYSSYPVFIKNDFATRSCVLSVKCHLVTHRWSS